MFVSLVKIQVVEVEFPRVSSDGICGSEQNVNWAMSTIQQQSGETGVAYVLRLKEVNHPVDSGSLRAIIISQAINGVGQTSPGVRAVTNIQ